MFYEACCSISNYIRYKTDCKQTVYNFTRNNHYIWYTAYMKKDTNIRIFYEDYKQLSKIAKQSGRTMKWMFKIILNAYKLK